MRITKNDNLFNNLVNFYKCGTSYKKTTFSINFAGWYDVQISYNPYIVKKLSEEDINCFRQDVSSLMERFETNNTTPNDYASLAILKKLKIIL